MSPEIAGEDGGCGKKYLFANVAGLGEIKCENNSILICSRMMWVGPCFVEVDVPLSEMF